MKRGWLLPTGLILGPPNVLDRALRMGAPWTVTLVVAEVVVRRHLVRERTVVTT